MLKFKLGNGMKTAIFILNEIFALMLITVILLTKNYGVNRGSWDDLLKHRTYETSDYFQTQSVNQATRALRAATRATKFENHGVYDQNRLVNVQEYANKGKITENKDTEGLYYCLGDLLGWAQDGFSYSTVQIDVEGVISFQLEDAPNSEELQEDLETYFVKSNNEWNAYYQYYRNIAESLTETYYDDYTKEILNEEYPPQNYRNLAAYATETGRDLDEVYGWIEKTLENIVSDVLSYRENINVFSMEESNVRYFLIDRDNRQVYTNVPQYRDASVSEIEKYIGKFSAYCIYDNQELSVKAQNIALGVTELYGYAEKYGFSGSENYEFAVAIDTKYPAPDILYSGYERYQKLQPIAWLTLISGVIGIIGYFITLIVLSAKAGEDPDMAGIQLVWFDYWKTEVGCLVVLLLASVGAVPLFILNGYFSFLTQEGLIGFVALGENIVFLVGWLSLLRRAKAKMLWKNSVACIVVHMIKSAFDNSRRTTKALAVFLAYLVGSFFLMQFGIQFLVLFNVAIGIFIMREAIQDQKLLDGMKKLEEGDLDYQYQLEEFNGFRREFAQALNEVHQVFLSSVMESMKNERMQTDLITNVSHDIKTPLTSIINYVNLLKMEKIENEKAKAYIDVLEQKSYRLKHLTEDLVEAAKISSGNITLQCTQIHMQEMICQAGGEFTDKFEASGLKLIENLPKEPLYIKADGRRLWRVLENLYNNVAKYAMPNTRVYVDLLDMGMEVKFSIKNISEQRLNIEAEDLTERFIRGDISRSTEGSGLGLSIARNLTELQGGRFSIYLDGDLFRVTIVFPKLEPLPDDLSIGSLEENLEAELEKKEEH